MILLTHNESTGCSLSEPKAVPCPKVNRPTSRNRVHTSFLLSVGRSYQPCDCWSKGGWRRASSPILWKVQEQIDKDLVCVRDEHSCFPNRNSINRFWKLPCLGKRRRAWFACTLTESHSGKMKIGIFQMVILGWDRTLTRCERALANSYWGLSNNIRCEVLIVLLKDASRLIQHTPLLELFRCATCLWIRKW